MSQNCAPADSAVYCRRVTSRHAKSFYFSSMGLPPRKKEAAYAVYAFCRYADDVVDEAPDHDTAAIAIEKVGREFDRILAGEAEELPFAPAFAWAVNRYQIPRQLFLDLVKGVSMDLGPVRLQTWEELRDYCYHVASVVGLMMCRIFELEDQTQQARAIDLGIAMQLTNICRDIREDHERGRIYLPAEELDRFGIPAGQLADGPVNQAWISLMQFQIARARDYYRSSEPGIQALAKDGSQFTVWLMRYVYGGILDEIERLRYDVFSRRAATSKWRKAQLALKAWRASRH